MKLLWTATLLMATLSFVGAGFAANLEIQGIYGKDDRRDIQEESNSNIRALADGTLAMIPKNMIKKDDDGNFSLKPTNFGEKYHLCESEPFRNQPINGDCSGFLVDDDLMVTAGHCISKTSCSQDFWLFNYQMSDKGEAPINIEKENIYRCKELIAQKQTATIDYAFFRLDRKVRGGRPLKMRSGPESKVGEKIFVIGYPMGLPAKIADNAKIRKWDKENKYFVTNLDTYGGNSGSPVFNAHSFEVEGILVRGDDDFVNGGSCKVSKHCQDSGCDGESVTNISFIQTLIKN